MKNFSAILISLLILYAGINLLGRIVSDDSRGLVIGLDGPLILDNDDLVVKISGDPQRTVYPDLISEHQSKDRNTVRISPESLPPGLHTLSWSEKYLGRKPRNVSFTVLSGPFAEPDSMLPCSLILSVGTGFLDPLFNDFEGRISHFLSEISVLPAHTGVSISSYIVGSGINVQADIGFRDGSQVHVRLPLTLVFNKYDNLEIRRRGDIESRITGILSTVAGIWGGGLSGIIDDLKDPAERSDTLLRSFREAGNRALSREVQSIVDKWLPYINAEMESAIPDTISIASGPLDLEIELEHCRQPAFEGRAIITAFNAKISVSDNQSIIKARHKESSAVKTSDPGGYVVRNKILTPPLITNRSLLALTISENLINSFLFEAWKASAIDLLIEETQIIEEINRELNYFTNFMAQSITPKLPPMLDILDDEIRAAMGEIEIELYSETEKTDLIIALMGDMRPESEKNRLLFNLKIHDLHASCNRKKGVYDIRTPCFTELIDEAKPYLDKQIFNFELNVPIGDISEIVEISFKETKLRYGAVDLVGVFKLP